MLRSAIAKNRIAVSAYLMDGLVPIQGDRVQLQQVLVNLILNAVEAMSSIRYLAVVRSSVLEYRDGANHSYALSGAPPLPVVNYHSKVSMIAEGKGSALQLIATYEAREVSDADAKRAVDWLIFGHSASVATWMLQRSPTDFSRYSAHPGEPAVASSSAGRP